MMAVSTATAPPRRNRPWAVLLGKAAWVTALGPSDPMADTLNSVTASPGRFSGPRLNPGYFQGLAPEGPGRMHTKHSAHPSILRDYLD